MSLVTNPGSAGLLNLGKDIGKFLRPQEITGYVKQTRFCDSLATKLANTSPPANLGKLHEMGSAIYAWVPRAQSEDMPCGAEIDDSCHFSNEEPEQHGLNLKFAQVAICHKKKGTFKFPKDQLYLMSSGNRSLIKKLVNQQISRDMIARIDSYGLRTPLLYAAADNFNTTMLGSITNPLPTNTEEDLLTMVRNLVTHAGQKGIICSMDHSFTVVVSWALYMKLAQALRGTNYCCDNSTLVTGKLRTIFGLDFVPGQRVPCYYDASTGQTVEYVMMIDTRDYFVPFDMLYNDWRDGGHDMLLDYSYYYDSYLLDPDSAVVATVKL
jgi:hypothetical protein